MPAVCVLLSAAPTKNAAISSGSNKRTPLRLEADRYIDEFGTPLLGVVDEPISAVPINRYGVCLIQQVRARSATSKKRSRNCPAEPAFPSSNLSKGRRDEPPYSHARQLGAVVVDSQLSQCG